MTAAEQLQQLRRDLTQFRKVSSLPYWRLAFVEFLLNRVDECVAVGRLPEADGLCQRARHWLEQNQPKKTFGEHAPHDQREVQWDAPIVAANVARLRADLQRKKNLVPAPERESFHQGLKRVELLLADQKVGKARAELDTVRSSLIRRLQRSYRARAQAAPLVRNADGSIKPAVRPVRNPLQPVGPYNNQRAVEDVFTLVGERDPIWVEDFLELYNNLQGYVARLGNPDKNMRKPTRG